MKTKLQFKLFFSLLLFSVFLSYSQCNTPTNIIVDGVTGTTVTLFWEDNNNPQASEWELEYGEMGFVQGTGTILASTSNVTTISGLLPGTQYDIYIRAICDINDSSNWSIVTNFNTLASCITPENLALVEVTETTVTLSWFEMNSPSATDWGIEYGLSGFTQGTGTTLSVTSNVTTISNLIAGTEYDVYVRAVCDVNDSSLWSNGLSFTTSFPPPACNGVFFDTGGTSNNYLDDENYTITITPDNVGEVVTVNFTFFNVESGYDGLMIYDGLDTSYPLISSGSNYNRPQCPNGAWTGNSDFAPTSITSTDNSGALTFVFTSDFTINRDGWEANVTCEVSNSCLRPVNFLVDGVTEDTVTLYWDEINNPQVTEWELEYGLSGFVQGTGTIITATSNLITISGLTHSTHYEVYVRSICDVNENSYWSLVLPFTTDSEPVIPPVCGGIFVDTGIL